MRIEAGVEKLFELPCVRDRNYGLFSGKLMRILLEGGLASQEEALAYIQSGLNIESSSGLDWEKWGDFRGSAEEILRYYKPNDSFPQTLKCWSRAFEDWVFSDKLASVTIALLNRGLERKGDIRRMIEPKVIAFALKAMAAGVRPGPGASECSEIIQAGIFFFADGEEKEARKNLWIAAALQNQLDCFLRTRRDQPYSLLPNEAIPIMLEAKKRQIREFVYALRSSDRGLIAASIAKANSPDQKTLIWLMIADTSTNDALAKRDEEIEKLRKQLNDMEKNNNELRVSAGITD